MSEKEIEFPDEHPISSDQYNKYRGELKYDDENRVERCAICDAEVVAGGDMYGGAAWCSESGEMLFDW